MLKLFNSLGKKLEPFEPVHPNRVTLFTCGPSVYQRSHIGNFRTFLFEDVLVRYLEFSGYRVVRGMNFTDLEDKALREAEKRGVSLRALTDENIGRFLEEMNLLRMKTPDYLVRASEAIEESVEIIERLLERGIAYRFKGNVYFDPLKFPRFGSLFGLDLGKWPKKKRRFHRDTYPGMNWNLGDFILWHGCKKSDSSCWETRIGKGRPSWNIQDPSMVMKHFDETLSIYCGGFDNLIRHHDYSIAILESVRPYPMAKFWLHGYHLLVNGRKMSKSRGNVYYVEDLLRQGYDAAAIRFFLIYGHYRQKLNFTFEAMRKVAERLRRFQGKFDSLRARAAQEASTDSDPQAASQLRSLFSRWMDDDLRVREAFDALDRFLSEQHIPSLSSSAARGFLKSLCEIDQVLQVLPKEEAAITPSPGKSFSG